MALEFSVPFDYNLCKNWLGVLETCRGCDQKLYELMYTSKEVSGCWVKFPGKVVHARASMSNVGQAIIKLELYEKWADVGT